MAKPNTTPPVAGTTAPAGNNEHKAKAPVTTEKKEGKVLSLPGMCIADECKKRSEKANFCMEHFDRFKEGLITKEGRRPSDFEKKFSDYSRRVKKSA